MTRNQIIRLVEEIDYGDDAAAIDRLLDLAAMGPLKRKSIDSRLERAGWIVPYDDEYSDAVDFNEDANPILFNENGGLNKSLWNAAERLR